ncbi:MAG: ribulose-phosphate 3-epimerase [Spirochaetaceae bacterium]
MDYKIAASILNADFLHLKNEIDTLIDHVDELHFDVMDGVFVENISFGAPVIGGLRGAYPKAFTEAHLMIARPHDYWADFQEAGCNVVIFHYEATDHSYMLLKDIREGGIQAGVSITPQTPVSVLEPIREFIDRVLIMTVEPGFGGQTFEPAMLRKIEEARRLFGDAVDIEVDGGVKDTTIAAIKNAGANVFVVGSYLFNAEDRVGRVNTLREALR